MPLGFERLNERTQRPNAHINFVRTLPGSSSATAERILSRVAAICYPFMKKHSILVQALEEYPYNTEFVGRNFNAGEVIQLVLRDARGRWLPQRMVEMVMAHELAHCKQMNHSQAFWKIRDEYARDLRALWGKGYTGEGIWGKGRELDTGAVQEREGEIMDVPEHLCGGTYGRRGAKRKKGAKEKAQVSYAERKQRSILKKFGAGGLTLGADDTARVKLESGVPKKGKPRVAGSARGRDLRAAAALARFDSLKKEEGNVTIKTDDTLSDSETEDEFIEGDQHGAAVDIDGKGMFDDKGRALIKICEEDDDKDEDSRREMNEIQGFSSRSKAESKSFTSGRSTKMQAVRSEPNSRGVKKEPFEMARIPRVGPPLKPTEKPTSSTSSTPKMPPNTKATPLSSCSMCSFENPIGALTCDACSHVLQPSFSPDSWSCKSIACRESSYINSGDAGSCGVCGEVRGKL